MILLKEQIKEFNSQIKLHSMILNLLSFYLQSLYICKPFGHTHAYFILLDVTTQDMAVQNMTTEELTSQQLISEKLT